MVGLDVVRLSSCWGAVSLFDAQDRQDTQPIDKRAGTRGTLRTRAWLAAESGAQDDTRAWRSGRSSDHGPSKFRPRADGFRGFFTATPGHSRPGTRLDRRKKRRYGHDCIRRIRSDLFRASLHDRSHLVPVAVAARRAERTARLHEQAFGSV